MARDIATPRVRQRRLLTPRAHGLSWYGVLFVLSLVMIAVAGLLTIEFEHQFWSNLLSISGICILSSVILLIAGKAGREHRKVFVLSLFIRLCIVLVMTLSPPVYTRNPWAGVPAIFPDEVWYTEQALAWSHSISVLPLDTPFSFVVAYMAIILRLLGSNILWIRLVHVLFGTLTAVLVYDAASRTLGERGRRVAFWLASLLPAFLLWSSVVLKEAIFVFGVSLLIAAAARLYQKHSRSLFDLGLAISGGIIIVLLRPVVVLFAVLPIFLVAATGGENRRVTASRVLLIIVAIVGILAFGIPDLIRRLQFHGGSMSVHDTAEAVLERAAAGVNTNPLVNYVTRIGGTFEFLAQPFLLMTSPPFTAVFGLVPFIGSPSWVNWVIASLAAGWWFCLPFTLRGILVSLRKRHIFWLSVTLAFVVWFIIATYGRSGGSLEAVRAREHLGPFWVLLACKGVDSLRAKSLAPGGSGRRVFQLYYASLITFGLLWTARSGILSLLSLLRLW